MIVFSYLGAPSSRGLDHKLYGLSGVGSVPGGVWVVLELEWGSRTPPAEFCRDHLTSPQPHPLLLLFFFFFGFYDRTGAFCFSFSPITIFPFFWAVASPLVMAADSLSVVLLYFGCYEY